MKSDRQLLVKIILVVVVFWSALLLMGEFYRYFTVPSSEALAILPFTRVEFWQDQYQKWDSSHYLSIARDGYQADEITFFDFRRLAFFPGYSAAIKLISLVTAENYVAAGLIVDGLCLIAALFFLFRLIRLDEDEKTSWLTIKYLLIYPWAFFFTLIYSESLFLFLSVLAFYLMRQKKWWAVGLVAGLATLTRSFGALLVFPALMESDFLVNLGALFFKKRPLSFAQFWTFFKYSWLLAFPFALGIYLLINKYYAGDCWAFLFYQKEVWFHHFVWPWQTIQEFWIMAHTTSWEWTLGTWGAQLVATVLTIILIICGYIKKIRPSYLIYSILYLLLILTMSWQISGARYLACLFPNFYIMAKLARRSPVLDLCLSIVLPLFLVLLWFLFLRGAVV